MGAAEAVFGRQDRLLVSQRDTAYQPRATPWVPSTASPGVLKERRIFLNRGRLPNPTRCGVPSERLIGGPRIPRVAPWAGMRRPFRAEADTPPLLVSRANRLWSSHQKFVLGVTQMSASSLFCQPESVMIDFAKALTQGASPVLFLEISPPIRIIQTVVYLVGHHSPILDPKLRN